MKRWRFVGVFEGLYAVVAADNGTQIRLAFNDDADGVVQMLNHLEQAAAFGHQCLQDDCEGAWIAATVHNEVKRQRDESRAKLAGSVDDLDAARAEIERLRAIPEVPTSELTDADVDFLLERYDLTEPGLQRRIVASFLVDNSRLTETLRSALAAADPKVPPCET